MPLLLLFSVFLLCGRIKGVGSLFLTRVSGIDTRAVCPAAPALQLEILRIMS